MYLGAYLDPSLLPADAGIAGSVFSVPSIRWSSLLANISLKRRALAPRPWFPDKSTFLIGNRAWQFGIRNWESGMAIRNWDEERGL